MIACAKCGTELPDFSVACYRCGTAIDQVTQVRPTSPSYIVPPPYKQQATVAASTAVAIGVLGAIAAAVVVGLIALTFYTRDRIDREGTPPGFTPTSSTTKQQQSTAPAPQPAEPPKRAEKIVNETRAIAAGGLWATPFRLPVAGTTKGGFTVGGGGKDIDAYIVDQPNYALLASGQPFRSALSFNRVERGRLNTSLDAGDYFLVFSNKHAMWYSKQIATELDIIY